MAQKMFEANRRTTYELFTKDPAAFVVPAHQREYAWTTEEVETLLGDLFDDRDAWSRPYFLGALLFSSEEESNNFQILDGQQRLVTMTLLIGALRRRLEVLGDPATAGKLDAVIKAGLITRESKPKMELQPTDQPVYIDLLSNGPKAAVLGDARLKKKPLVRAWQTIWGIVANPNADIEELKRMVERVLYTVNFVQIEATSHSEAFVLFETLNDRGLDLNAADLIKNRLLSMVAPEKLSSTRDSWTAALEEIKSDEAVHFLRAHYIAHYGFVRKEGLYTVMKKTLEAEPKPEAAALEFIHHLKAQASIYGFILSPTSKGAPWTTEIGRRLQRLKMVNARGFRPLVLLVQERAPTSLGALLRIIEALTIRFSTIGGRNPNKLEKAYSQIAEDIRTSSDAPEKIAAKRLEGLMPSDDEFRASFVSFETDNTTSSVRAVMEGLHEFATAGATTLAEPASLHVDHILPQSIPPEALAHGSLSRENAEDLVGTFGNLTFLLKKPNIQASNKAFPHKKALYSEAIGLPLTQKLGEIQTWDAAAIRKRTETLADIAVGGWRW